MHIKNIIISGFRSYREQRFDADLSPRNNIVVGRNGSGKSNFFAAVQFVLSEKFANLRAHERHELFHVGAGRPSLSVFVEIVFDNTDGRFAMPGRPDEPEIRLRRILGLKQDEFRVNDRRYSAAEVRQLLETAGFSASNPYYIVEQGKITHLANMSEADRYALLKDVAGTHVYEARRRESVQVLEETDGRRAKIKEAIGQLDARVRELEAETSELRHFQEADRKRRSVEYCIYNAQLSAAKAALAKLEADWERTVAGNYKGRDEEQRLERAVADADAGAHRVGHQLRRIEEEKKRVEAERAVLASKRAVLDLKVKDATMGSERGRKERDALAKESSALQKRVAECKESLASKTKLRQSKQKESDKAVDALSAMEVRLEALQAKRGRGQQFQTRADRDKWLAAEIRRNESVIANNVKESAALEGERGRCQSAATGEHKAVREGQDAGKDAAAKAESAATARKAITQKRDALNIERRTLWQQVNAQEAVVRRATEEHDRAKARMDRATRNDIRQGLQSLRESLQEIGDSGLAAAVHGQLLDLIQVEEAFVSAVEVTVGNALFNVVVDSFDVSTRLLDHMNRARKPGRVTFFPLDTCNAFPRDIPTTAECSPLIKHVQYEKKFAPVVAELLGRTAVATTMDAGARLVRELDTDVVTIDGDQFNRRGGITGGFFDNRNLKLAAHRELQAAAGTLAEAKAVLDKLCAVVGGVEQQITEAMQQLERVNADDTAHHRLAESSRTGRRQHEEAALRLEQQADQLSKALDVLRRNNIALEATNASLAAELKTEMTKTLTAAEEKELVALVADAAKLRASVAVDQAAVVQLATDAQLLDDTIRHLDRREHAVADRIAALDMVRSGTDADDLAAQELAAIDADMKALDARIAAADTAVVDSTREHKVMEDRAHEARRELMAATREHQKDKDAADSAQNMRTTQIQKRDEALSNIRKLGVVPAEAAQYAHHSIGKLMVMMKAANDEIKKYAHVNKKALDQHTTVVESRTTLDAEVAVLDRELQAIQDLMARLDHEKGAAIERTLKQVQHNFEAVFRDLVTAEGATAALQMIEAPGRGRDKDRGDGDRFSGVRIEACFGIGSAVAELAQLSGGQKSLVALALIFAIQRCDPAPFYLFDEIDAALDAEYRTTVAAMLAAEADRCQFITATFREEMLDVADRVLGISFSNKVSRVQYISKEEGRRLLALAQTDGKRPREEQEEHATPTD